MTLYSTWRVIKIILSIVVHGERQIQKDLFTWSRNFIFLDSFVHLFYKILFLTYQIVSWRSSVCSRRTWDSGKQYSRFGVSGTGWPYPFVCETACCCCHSRLCLSHLAHPHCCWSMQFHCNTRSPMSIQLSRDSPFHGSDLRFGHNSICHDSCIVTHKTAL